MSKKTSLDKNNKIKKIRKKGSSFMGKLSDLPVFVHIVIIFTLILVGFLIFAISPNNSSPLYKEALKNSILNPTRHLRHDVFADHFVNNLSIDQKKSNFYFDVISTAHTFVPLYNWVDKGGCSSPYCNLSSQDWDYPGYQESGEEVKYCLANNCLSLLGGELKYNDRSLSYPEEIKDKNIQNISLYALDSFWLIGFVYSEDGQEKGRAYRYDGDGYMDLDMQNNFPFVSRENFKGASIGFGGDDGNYLVMYGAYDFLGYQVTGGKKYDISRFFGLRVSDGGFLPIAYKQKRNAETLWYVCSLSEGEPRLIKLWQNSSDSIKGSLVFSESILDDIEDADNAWCRENNNLGELELVVERRGDYYLRQFQDNGFKQEAYTLQSSNILKKKGEAYQASFSDLLACSNETCEENSVASDLNFSVSGNGQDFFRVNLNKEISFPSESNGIYWQLSSNGREGEYDYSPWIDGLISISYSWWQ